MAINPICIFKPLHASVPTIAKAKFAFYALSSASHFAKHQFTNSEAQSVFAGMGAHSMLPLNTPTTSSMAIVLNILAHVNSWPLPKGGAQQITNALAACFKHLGGEIQTDSMIISLKQLPSCKALLIDLTPKQLCAIAGEQINGIAQFS